MKMWQCLQVQVFDCKEFHSPACLNGILWLTPVYLIVLMSHRLWAKTDLEFEACCHTLL